MRDAVQVLRGAEHAPALGASIHAHLSPDGPVAAAASAAWGHAPSKAAVEHVLQLLWTGQDVVSDPIPGNHPDPSHVPGPQGHPGHYKLIKPEDTDNWILFFVLFTALILFDNLWLHRKNEKLSFGVACKHCLFWIGCAGAFNLSVWYTHGAENAINWGTGYLLEWMLSVDNLFVFRSIFVVLGTPDSQKHKPLFWGIVGAIFFRMAFFMVEELLVHSFTWAFSVLGLFLIYTGVKVITSDDGEFSMHENPWMGKFLTMIGFVNAYAPEANFFAKVPIDPVSDQPYLTEDWVAPMSTRALLPQGPPTESAVYETRATRLLLVVVCLELADVVFAVDSVSAIVAQIPDLYLAYTACVFAMLGLRATFFVVDELVNLFTLLPYAVGAILVFLGIKLMLRSWIHIPPQLVCGLIFGTLFFTMVLSNYQDNIIEILSPSYCGSPKKADEENADAVKEFNDAVVVNGAGGPSP